MASNDYSGLKKAELIRIAKRKKAPVALSMSKDQIIKAIKKAEKARVKAKPAKKAKAGRAAPAKKTAPKKAAVSSRAKKKAKTKAAPVSKTTIPPTARKKKIANAPGKKAVPAAWAVVEKKRPAVAARPVEKESAPEYTVKANGERRNWDIPLDVKKFFTADEREDMPQTDPAPTYTPTPP